MTILDGGEVDKTYGPGSGAALPSKGIHTENWKREVSEIFMSNKEAVRTNGPVLFLAAPLRPQPNSPISLSPSCIFETEGFLTQSQLSILELLAGNREAKGAS